VPPQDAPPQENITEESYSLEITVKDPGGNQVDLPGELETQHGSELGKLFMLPHMLDTFIVNLELPALPLKQLNLDPAPEKLIKAINSILTYLCDDNPHLLTYRFGIPTGLGMQQGLVELLEVLEWCSAAGYQLSLRATRRYFSLTDQKLIVQQEQETAQPWM
jgi:hypothetical protein